MADHHRLVGADRLRALSLLAGNPNVVDVPAAAVAAAAFAHGGTLADAGADVPDALARAAGFFDLDVAAAAAPSVRAALAQLEDDAPPSTLRVARANKTTARRAAKSPGDVLAQWEREGPLVHVATGLASLDALTGGGPPLGALVVVTAPPDNCKTALLVQVADERLVAGDAVGIYAVDEDDSGIVTRLLQRRGFARETCSARGAHTLIAARAALAGLRLRIYGPEWTVQAAAADLAAFRDEHGGNGILVVDSLQTVQADNEDPRGSPFLAVKQRVYALKEAAARYRLAVFATSEMNRGGYRSKQADERVDDMASGSGSGAIEYASKLLLSLRQVDSAADVFELRIAKNKFGPRHRSEESGLFLRLDRDRQTLTEAGDYAPQATGDRVAAQDLKDATAVFTYLLAHPGTGVRDLHDALRGQVHKDRIDRVRRQFRDAIDERKDKRRLLLFAIADKLPAPLRSGGVFEPVQATEPTVPDRSGTFQEQSEPSAGIVPSRPYRGRNGGTIPPSAARPTSARPTSTAKGKAKGKAKGRVAPAFTPSPSGIIAQGADGQLLRSRPLDPMRPKPAPVDGMTGGDA